MGLTDDLEGSSLGGGLTVGVIAKIICEKLEKQCRFAYIANELRYYKDGWFQRNGEDFVRAELQRTLPDISQHQLNEVIAKLSQRNYRDLKECDPDPNIINVQNGLLDLKKMRLAPHTPDYLSIRQFPVKFEKYPKSKNKIRKLLQETLNKDELRKLQMALGDIFVKGYPYQTIFFFVGSGHNRKGLVARLIKKLLGLELFSAVRLCMLADSRFATAELFNKAVNVAGDDSATSPDNWNVIRSLAGGDLIPAERKGQQIFHFVNEAKLFFIFNKLPPIDEDFATWRRVQLIRFTKDFSEKENNYDVRHFGGGGSDGIYNDNNNNSSSSGNGFEASLHTAECMSELLLFALEGRRILLKNHGHDKEDINAIKTEYKKLQDHIVAFMHECFDISPELSVETKLAYQIYCQYCKDKGITPIADNEFGSKLAENGISKRRPRAGPKRQYVYTGIGVKGMGLV
jgi:P4 family phage/plasmid primase-like protien